jgi:hypothetical protein
MALIGFFGSVIVLILLTIFIFFWMFAILFCYGAFDQKIEFASIPTLIIILLLAFDVYGWYQVYQHSPLSIVMTNYK